MVKKVNNINYYISDVSDGNLALHIWDDEKLVINNRKNLASKLWFDLEDFVFLDQVHWSHIKIISNEDKWVGIYDHNSAFEADSIITKEKWIVIWVLVADCVPVLLHDKEQWIVCAVHAGWKSTNKKILKNSINEMINNWSEKQNIKTILWPSISEHSYEVWEEVWNNFRDEVKTKIIDWKQYLNLKLENKLQAIESWIKESNIEVVNIDTFTDKKYFSARRDWFWKWRFGVFIWIG